MTGSVSKKHGKVLVMDDEESVRVLTGEALDFLGCEAVMAGDGAAALVLYQQALDEGKPFDLVIMDLTVPQGMGAEETMRQLLRIDPRARVIVSSGYVQDQVMARYGEYGFSGVLAKPFSLQQLAAVLQEFIGGDTSAFSLNI